MSSSQLRRSRRLFSSYSRLPSSGSRLEVSFEEAPLKNGPIFCQANRDRCSRLNARAKQLSAFLHHANGPILNFQLNSLFEASNPASFIEDDRSSGGLDAEVRRHRQILHPDHCIRLVRTACTLCPMCLRTTTGVVFIRCQPVCSVRPHLPELNQTS